MDSETEFQSNLEPIDEPMEMMAVRGRLRHFIPHSILVTFFGHLRLDRMPLFSHGLIQCKCRPRKQPRVSVQVAQPSAKWSRSLTQTVFPVLGSISIRTNICLIIQSTNTPQSPARAKMPFYTIHCNSKKNKEEFSTKLAQFHAETFGGDAIAVRVSSIVIAVLTTVMMLVRGDL